MVSQVTAKQDQEEPLRLLVVKVEPALASCTCEALQREAGFLACPMQPSQNTKRR